MTDQAVAREVDRRWDGAGHLVGEALGGTAPASAFADALGAPLIRLRCHGGIDASSALYDWDFPRRLPRLRAAEAAGVTDADRLESELRIG
ncbi:hypothetical protein AQI95_36725 [Streptomyces yokosukanensis]|uniref:Uncharacterized protein n=1 Tax=Streptomyces yokosukanensis TaxID=67386 RepID=A0A101NV46_9ACTN|nr:hypothetical protein AQI95_36725 [Streptomyces yokosukanensis]